MYHNDWDIANYYLPCNMFIPFIDDSTIEGYVVQFVVQFWAIYSYCVVIVGIIMYFVSCCLYIKASCQEFAQIFDDVNEKVRTKIDYGTVIKIKCRLRDAIQLHMKVLE